MAEIGQRAKVKVSQLGKWKTTAQMVAIGMLLYRDDLFGIPVKPDWLWSSVYCRRINVMVYD